MNITFYRTGDEPNKVSKGLTQVSDMSGTLKSESNVVDPTIIIEADNPSSWNYARIADFNNRYYFIKDMKNIRNNIWEISMHCDVLYTYRNNILNQKCIISKQANLSNSYIDDHSVITSAIKKYHTVEFNGGFNDNPTFVLSVSGGKDGVSNG